jgi:hypothetical protein
MSEKPLSETWEQKYLADTSAYGTIIWRDELTDEIAALEDGLRDAIEHIENWPISGDDPITLLAKLRNLIGGDDGQ